MFLISATVIMARFVAFVELVRLIVFDFVFPLVFVVFVCLAHNLHLTNTVGTCVKSFMWIHRNLFTHYTKVLFWLVCLD